MLGHIIGWVSGYVILQVYGENKERLLNVALQQGVEIYDIVWLDEQVVQAKVNYRQIRKLRKIAKQTKCSFKIKTKAGLPFYYQYFKSRKTLAVGVFVFLLGVYCLSNLAFGVTVTNREELIALDMAEVKLKAEELGVHWGAVIKDLDFGAIEKQLKKEIPELSWVNIERHGTLLNIMVAERNLYSEEEQKATIGAIWANQDALIEEVLIKHGTAMVAAGDTVGEGQLLVSPLADGRADAIIKARVWYEGYGETPLREAVTGGASKNEKVLYLLDEEGNNKLQLWGRTFTQENQLKEKLILQETKHQARLWQDQYLPLCLLEENYQNNLLLYTDNSEEQAKAKALAKAITKLELQLGKNNKLLNERVYYKLLNNQLWTVNVKWECMEEIGIRNHTE